MTTGNTSLLKLALPVEGELDGTWGDVVNDSITSLVDTAVAGTTTLSTDADVTLSDTALAANQARQAILLWTASGTVTRNITAPARSKAYVVINATGGSQSIVLRGAGPTTGITIVSGERCVAAWNGSDFVKVSTSTADGVTSVGGTGTVNGITLTGTVTSTGNLTLGGALTGVDLTSQVTGTLPIANGGTGTTTPNLVAGANVTITGTWPNQTINAAAPGTGTVTSVGLTMPSGFSVAGSPVTSTGTLAVTTALNGIVKGNGSGFTTATSGTDYAPATSGSSLLYGNGAGGFSNVTIGTGVTFAGGVLSATGTGSVTSVAVSGGTTGLTTSGGPITSSGTITIAGTLAVANGGTGATTASAARSALGLAIGTDVPSPTGSGASGTWGINISGSAAQVTTTNFTIQESGGKLVFKYGSTVIASMDSSGNIVTAANVTAYGTP